MVPGRVYSRISSGITRAHVGYSAERTYLLPALGRCVVFHSAARAGLSLGLLFIVKKCCQTWQ